MQKFSFRIFETRFYAFSVVATSTPKHTSFTSTTWKTLTYGKKRVLLIFYRGSFKWKIDMVLGEVWNEVDKYIFVLTYTFSVKTYPII
jgi:hypothetical protein